MDTRKYRLALAIIFLVGLAVRLLSLPLVPFYGDVPGQVKVIENGSYLIQFPGYAPFHVIVGAIAHAGVSVFHALWLISLITTTLAAIYVTRAAEEMAGRAFGLFAAVIMSVGVLTIYFALAGASYGTDMLCMAGLLFHGWKAMRTGDRPQFYFAIAWWCFGLLMRPVSAAFCGLGVLYLVYRRRSLREFVVTVAAVTVTLIAYVAISVHFYGSLDEFIHASRLLNEEVTGTEWKQTATNVFRAIAYPVFGFHIWLIFAVITVLKFRGNRSKPELVYLLLLAVPYQALLFRYIPHAAYYCLVIPAIVLAPACFLNYGKGYPLSRITAFAGAFFVVSLAQWFLLSPVRVTSTATGVADAYFLQYTRAGMKAGAFDTLSSILLENHVNENAIPAERKKFLLETPGGK